MDRKKWSQLIKMLYNSHTQGVIDWLFFWYQVSQVFLDKGLLNETQSDSLLMLKKCFIGKSLKLEQVNTVMNMAFKKRSVPCARWESDVSGAVGSQLRSRQHPPRLCIPGLLQRRLCRVVSARHCRSPSDSVIAAGFCCHRGQLLPSATADANRVTWGWQWTECTYGGFLLVPCEMLCCECSALNGSQCGPDCSINGCSEMKWQQKCCRHRRQR